jgi:hypothetical protein
LQVGGRIELGGAEALDTDTWAGRLFGATADPREVIGSPHASNFGAELHGGGLTPGACARIGPTDLPTRLAAQPEGAAR